MMNGIRMNWERVLLIAFLGNYIINNVVTGIVSLIPAGAPGSFLTAQYITYIVCAAVVVGLLTWWYFCTAMGTIKTGLVFGISGFVISILTTLISGMAGVLAQSGSLAQLAKVKVS